MKLKSKKFCILLFALLLSAAAACDSDVRTEQCQYQDIPGTAEIISNSTPSQNENNCPNNPVKVTFNFTPTDPAASAGYRFPAWPDEGRGFTTGDGKNPSSDCVTSASLTVGSEHACIRSEITKGTCTPVIFSFPDVDKAQCLSTCFN